MRSLQESGVFTVPSLVGLHPRLLCPLSELNGLHSAAEMRGVPFDLVVTVCDTAAEECPVWLGVGRRVHLGFPDLGKATGPEAQVMDLFRQVRDEMVSKILTLLEGSADN